MQQIGLHLIERLVELLGFDLEGKLGIITADQMIAVRTRLAALTLLTAGKLLEVPKQFFDPPAHVIHVLSDLCRHGLRWAIGDHPVNVAVHGDQLEQPHFERDFFQFHEHTVLEACGVHSIWPR
jgi:hypothetical protein